MRKRSTPTAAQDSYNPIVRYFRVLGPGLVTGAADDDPSGITEPFALHARTMLTPAS